MDLKHIYEQIIVPFLRNGVLPLAIGIGGGMGGAYLSGNSSVEVAKINYEANRITTRGQVLTETLKTLDKLNPKEAERLAIELSNKFSDISNKVTADPMLSQDLNVKCDPNKVGSCLPSTLAETQNKNNKESVILERSPNLSELNEDNPAPKDDINAYGRQPQNLRIR